MKAEASYHSHKRRFMSEQLGTWEQHTGYDKAEEIDGVEDGRLPK